MVAMDAQERGARSHLGMVSSGRGLSTLRLLWNISKGWTLHHGCSRRQIKRCLGTLSWGAVCGSPGSVCAIAGRGTGLTPGPELMPSTGANHGWRTAEGLKWGGRAAAERHGSTELSASGSRAGGCAAACSRGHALGSGRCDSGSAGLALGGKGVKENEGGGGGGGGAFLMVLQGT